MADRPAVKPGDWIRIGSVDCVVSTVRPPNDEWGDCEVAFDPEKPTNADVKWTGDAWQFVEKVISVAMQTSISACGPTLQS